MADKVLFKSLKRLYFKKVLSIFIFFIFAVILLGCGTKISPEEKDRIEEVLSNWERFYEIEDLDGLMSLYTDDFLHKGQDKQQMRIVFKHIFKEVDIIDYQREILSIRQKRKAFCVRFKWKIKYTCQGEDPQFQAGQEKMFLRNEGSILKICGNQKKK